MVATLTPIVGYTLDPTGQIGVQHVNWDRADEVAGLMYTTSAAGPDMTKSYEGCVWVEKDTGISYRMIKVTGVLTKFYVNYPMIYKAGVTTGVFGASTQQEWGWNNVLEQINANPATWKEAGTNAIKFQVKGLYQVKSHAVFYPSAGTSGWGYTGLGRTVNAVNDTGLISTKLVPAGAVTGWTITQSWQQVFNVNDKLRPFIQNYCNVGVSTDLLVELSMIRPVW